MVLNAAATRNAAELIPFADVSLAGCSAHSPGRCSSRRHPGLDGQSHRPHGWLTGADRSNVVLAAELEVPTNGVDADAVFEYVGALESTTYRSSCAHSKEPG
jgi:hypothetical protein